MNKPSQHEQYKIRGNQKHHYYSRYCTVTWSAVSTYTDTISSSSSLHRPAQTNINRHQHNNNNKSSQVKSSQFKKMDSMSALSNSFETDHYERNLIVPVSTTNHQQATTHSHSHSHSQQQQGEHAPAYRLLLSRNLLVTRYRKDTFEDVFLEEDLEPNSTHADNFQKRWRWGVYWTPGCGLVVYVS